MAKLTKDFKDRQNATGLYMTLLRGLLGTVYTVEDIDDVFIKLKNRAPELLEDKKISKSVDMNQVIQCMAIKEQISWKDAKALGLRDPERLFSVAAHHATHPSICIVKGMKPL